MTSPLPVAELGGVRHLTSYAVINMFMQKSGPDSKNIHPSSEEPVVDWMTNPFVIAGIHLLNSFEKWLFKLPIALFYILISTILLLQSGVWIVPITNYLRHFSSDITRQLTQENPQADYLYTSFFGLALTNWTGAWKSPATFAMLHLAVLCLGIVSLQWIIHRRFGDQRARIFALTFVTVPLSSILLTWLGMSDVYVFIFSTSIILVESVPLIALFAFLLGTAHFEQGLVIVSGLSACSIGQAIQRGRSWRTAIASVAALLGGMLGAHLALDWYFSVHHFHLTMTRGAFMFTDGRLHQFLSNDARHFQTLIFSLHGCYWLVVCGVTLWIWRSHRMLAWGVILIHFIFIGITLLSLDSTRVFSLLIWPFLVLFLRSEVVSTEHLRPITVGAYACGLVIPKLVVWEGVVHSGTLYYGLVLAAQLIVHHELPHDPGWLMQPFK